MWFCSIGISTFAFTDGKKCLSSHLLGDELEYLRPNVYRNVARQLNITVTSENIVSDAFLAVAAEIFSTGW